MSDRELYEEGLLMDLEKAHKRIEELEAKLEKAVLHLTAAVILLESHGKTVDKLVGIKND